MKTLTYNAYRYLGVKDGWHVFECTKQNFDREVLLLEKARMIMEDGSSKFYDALVPSSQLSFNMDNEKTDRNRRLGAYAKAISNSTSVNSVAHRMHILKKWRQK